MKKVLKIFKRIKISSLLFLIFLLMFNTYAWFIFISKVSTKLTVSVSSWNITFKSDEQVITNNVNIKITKALPGMNDFSQKITVINDGQTKAYLTYSITSMKIFGVTYTVGENPKSLTEEEQTNCTNGYPLRCRNIFSRTNRRND